MGNEIDAFTEQFLRIIDRILFMEKNNILIFNDDIKLFPSEIHLILLISGGNAGNFNSIARKLGITKSAVSQTVTRLVKKGIFEKRKEANKNNEMEILFTPIGKKVRLQCKKMQDTVFGKFSEYYTSLTQNDRDVIGRFLNHFENEIEELGDGQHHIKQK